MREYSEFIKHRKIYLYIECTCMKRHVIKVEHVDEFMCLILILIASSLTLY